MVSNGCQSAVSFAAGGGDLTLPLNNICALPRNPSGLIIQRCAVFDMVMAPCRGDPPSTGTYCWAAGTSMASPAVAGVAALQANGKRRVWFFGSAAEKGQ